MSKGVGKIVFFSFLPLNYGAGISLNVLQLGRWLSSKGYKVSFVDASDGLAEIFCRVTGMGRYTKNLTDKDVHSLCGAGKRYRYTLTDLMTRSGNWASIFKALDGCSLIYPDNELISLMTLRLFFGRWSEKEVIGFHTPIEYKSGRSLRHGLHNLLYSSLLYSALIGASKCRVLSKAQQSQLTRMGKDIRVIPNSVDLEDFKPAGKKNGRSFKIYFIGRMTYQKGADILNDLVEILSETAIFHQVEFYFAGQGDMQTVPAGLAERFDNCHYLGYVRERPRCYRDADLLIFPSRWECCSNVVLEAMACGTPILTSSHSCCAEQVTDMEEGWVVDSNSPADYARAIQEIFSIWKHDRKRYEKMRGKARAHAECKHNREITNEILEDLFRKVSSPS